VAHFFVSFRALRSTYPLGGSVTAALILSTSAALAATMYATASCRFVVIRFSSNTGGFEEHFGTNRGGTDNGSVQYKAAVGLYQWLRPYDPALWSTGACAGYQQTMLASISDTYFEAARTFGVFAVLMAVVKVCWIFLSACLDMNRFQAILFCVLSFVGTVSTGMTFMFHKSSLCTTQFLTRECEVDEGGLVMIAATVLWLITFMVSVYFVLPLTGESDEDRQERLAAEKRTRAKKADNRKVKEKTKKKDERIKTQSKDAPMKNYSFESPVPSRTKALQQQSRQQARSSRQLTRTSQDSRPASSHQPQSSQQPDQTEQQQEEPQPSCSAIGRRFFPPRHVTPAIEPNRTQSSLTIDDKSNREATEVYIAKRLNRIEELAEV
jgi:hypothetical protein